MNDILNIISSSSSGNCYIYNQDLMVDIGVPFSKIKSYYKDIKLLLLTHLHSDHLMKTTLKKIIYEKPTLKIVCGWWLVNNLVEIGVDKKNIYVLEIDKKYDLGKYIIEPVMAFHDVPNCGYKIIIKSTNYKIFHISDTGSIDHIEAKDYDWYSIEGNYETDEEIKKKIKEAREKGEFCYLERVQNTHINQVKALNWLNKNKGVDSQFQFIHQHEDKEENNE